MIDQADEQLSVVKQCELLQLSRSGFYYEPVQESAENLAVMRFLDEQYLSTPYYGVKRLLVLLVVAGYHINAKRLRRLMKLVGWQTLYCAPRTTQADKAAYKYPYLLRGLQIERRNQVWAIDITYVPLQQGFMYLCPAPQGYARWRLRLLADKVVELNYCDSISHEWVGQVLKKTK